MADREMRQAEECYGGAEEELRADHSCRHISLNSFTGSLPTELGQLTQMTTLFVDHNPLLCGHIPEGVTPRTLRGTQLGQPCPGEGTRGVEGADRLSSGLPLGGLLVEADGKPGVFSAEDTGFDDSVYGIEHVGLQATPAGAAAPSLSWAFGKEVCRHARGCKVDICGFEPGVYNLSGVIAWRDFTGPDPNSTLHSVIIIEAPSPLPLSLAQMTPPAPPAYPTPSPVAARTPFTAVPPSVPHPPAKLTQVSSRVTFASLESGALQDQAFDSGFQAGFQAQMTAAATTSGSLSVVNIVDIIAGSAIVESIASFPADTSGAAAAAEAAQVFAQTLRDSPAEIFTDPMFQSYGPITSSQVTVSVSWSASSPPPSLRIPVPEPNGDDVDEGDDLEDRGDSNVNRAAVAAAFSGSALFVAVSAGTYVCTRHKKCWRRCPCHKRYKESGDQLHLDVLMASNPTFTNASDHNRAPREIVWEEISVQSIAMKVPSSPMSLRQQASPQNFESTFLKLDDDIHAQSDGMGGVRIEREHHNIGDGNIVEDGEQEQEVVMMMEEENEVEQGSITVPVSLYSVAYASDSEYRKGSDSQPEFRQSQ
eukprot:gene10830-12813_t